MPKPLLFEIGKYTYQLAPLDSSAKYVVNIKPPFGRLPEVERNRLQQGIYARGGENLRAVVASNDPFLYDLPKLNPIDMKLSDEQVKKLRERLPDVALKPHPSKSYLTTINPAYVLERLNEVFGTGGWTIRHDVIEQDKMVVLHAVFEVPELGIRIEGYGGNDNPDRGDAYKGAATDALTKIASYLGIGLHVWKDKKDNGETRTTAKEFPASEKQIEFLQNLLKKHPALPKSGKDKVEQGLAVGMTSKEATAAIEWISKHKQDGSK